MFQCCFSTCWTLQPLLVIVASVSQTGSALSESHEPVPPDFAVGVGGGHSSLILMPYIFLVELIVGSVLSVNTKLTF